jgi:hypothetical protein
VKRFLFILLFSLPCCAAFAQGRSANTPGGELLKYYPNPAISFINFEFQKSHSNTHTLQVFNFMGKKVLEVKNTPARMNLGLESLYRGIYVFQLRDVGGNILQSGKFQVVR